jgi:hypothetical protein
MMLGIVGNEQLNAIAQDVKESLQQARCSSARPRPHIII